MNDWRSSLSFIMNRMNRRIMTGLIVRLRVASQGRIFRKRAFVLILLTPWWIRQQQNVSSLDSVASLGAQQFGESIQRFPITITPNSMNAVSSKQYVNEPWLSGDTRVSCTRDHKLDHDGADGTSVFRGSGEASNTIDMLTVFNCSLKGLPPLQTGLKNDSRAGDRPCSSPLTKR